MDESIWEIHEEIKRFGGLLMKHDTFFRETFDMLEISKEFLQYAIPQKMSQNFDFGKLTQESIL